eukprot:TRINITY_DN9332_c0_g1_i8.p1 TRINITY_DN9332_c0_g1~~TRINITY_DN9332_c0_g1_i8.p1  ORF type:complete len:220 (-),score=7.50 TRINITY_DN9332_c0_g1_i8:1575-2201(-)
MAAPVPLQRASAPRRTARQRREQRVRAQGRTIADVISSFDAIQRHRGGELKGLASALHVALTGHARSPEPSVVPLPRFYRACQLASEHMAAVDLVEFGTQTDASDCLESGGSADPPRGHTERVDSQRIWHRNGHSRWVSQNIGPTMAICRSCWSVACQCERIRATTTPGPVVATAICRSCWSVECQCARRKFVATPTAAPTAQPLPAL